MDIRSFLAFELPPDIKKAVSAVQGEMKPLLPDARWLRVDSIHLTVVFMGGVSSSLLSEMAEPIGEVFGECGPVRVFLSGVGIFGARRRPRVLWIDLEGEVEGAALFRDRLQERLLPFGIEKEERGFRPHLTLARFPRGVRAGRELDRALDAHRDLRGPEWELGRLVLYKSDLRPRGAGYTALGSGAMGGRLLCGKRTGGYEQVVRPIRRESQADIQGSAGERTVNNIHR